MNFVQRLTQQAVYIDSYDSLAFAPVRRPRVTSMLFHVAGHVEVSLLASLRFNKNQVFYCYHALAVCDSSELAGCSSVRVYS
jgi:hypothetical protein